jgi:hypothetical protein
VAVAPVRAALMEHLAAVAGCYPEPARKKLPLAQRLPSKPSQCSLGFGFIFYFLIFSNFQKN